MDVFFYESVDDIEQENKTIFVLPYVDKVSTEKTVTILLERSGVVDFDIICVHDSQRDGFVKIANAVYEKTQSDYFGYVASDAFPGRQWLAIGQSALERENRSFLAFNDGKWFGRCAGFGLARRKWINSIYDDNTVFFHGYKSHYADTELTILASLCGQLAYDPNAILIEVDFDKDKKISDLGDRSLYLQRLADLKKLNGWVSTEAFGWFKYE